MSRIDSSRLLILVLLALLTPAMGLAEQQDLLAADEQVSRQINYRTESVYRGDYLRTTAATASVYYPITFKASFEFEAGEVQFIRYTVKNGAAVKKGDVLAELSVGGSEVELKRMELELKRAEEEMSEGVRMRREEIALLRAEAAAQTDQNEREKKKLLLRKKEIELEQYEARQARSIGYQRAALEEEIARRQTDVLVSPADGIVSDLIYKRANEPISSGEALVTLYSDEVMLLKVENSAGGFRYNMPVSIETGTGKRQTTLTGRVVAADDAVAESARAGYAYILPDPYEGDVLWRSTKATAPTVLVEDVLLAKRSAVTLESGMYSVTRLTDGMVQKRYVECGMNNMSEIWILSGVSEGDALVVD